jgi:hypothetical protein
LSDERWVWWFLLAPIAISIFLDVVLSQAVGTWFLLTAWCATVLFAIALWVGQRDRVWLRCAASSLFLIWAFPGSALLGSRWPMVTALAAMVVLLALEWSLKRLRGRRRRTQVDARTNG